MSAPLTHRDLLSAVLTSGLVIWVSGIWVFSNDALAAASVAANQAAGNDGRLEAPPAASGSPRIDDLEIPIRPQSYPGLPSTDPLAQDPEQLREALRQDVERALAEAPELADSSLLAHVTSLRRARLRGVVGSDSTRILAEIIAAGVDGISGVDNGPRIEAEPE